jgi:hypothetical protein
LQARGFDGVQAASVATVEEEEQFLMGEAASA